MLRRSLNFRMATAVALALLVSSPAAAQLDQRLTEAGQKLDSDIQNCTPINMGDYANLLREAVENKQRAEKAARRGVPIDQAKVDGDLANAQSLFNRANAALVQQCIRNATQPQTQPQQATPQTQTTGAAPAAQPAQGLTQQDIDAVARQQWTIESFESALTELKTLLQQGKCDAAEDLIDELDEWLDELESPTPVIRPAGLGPTPRIPARLIEEWDRRIDEMLDDCPEPGRPKFNISAILRAHNDERARFGYEPLRWSIRLADNAQTYANQLGQTGQLAHASREGRGIERENLSQGLLGWTADQLMDNWLKERSYFTPGNFPDVSTTGNWYDVGHYSQMIWPTTTAFGCGMASGSGFSWLVCRYSPGGNKDGKPVGQMQTPEIAMDERDRIALTARLVDHRTTPAGGNVDLSKMPWEPEHPTTPEPTGSRASLFDLGIYSGGAWTTDWFDVPEAGNSPALQDSIMLGDYFSLNLGVRADAYDSGPPPSTFPGLDFGLGAADGLSVEPVPVDTNVEQPVLPPSEVFSSNKPAAANPTKYEPSNPLPRCGGFAFFEGAKLYEAAKAKGDAGGMTAAKAMMAQGIASQRQSVEDAFAAGEMGGVTVGEKTINIGPAGFMQVLEGMMDQYEELTGEKAPGKYDPPPGYELADGVSKPVDTPVQQPELPIEELFKQAAQQNQCSQDVM